MNVYPASFDATPINAEELPTWAAGEQLACNWGDPEDCKADNDVRAQNAAVAIKAYATTIDSLPEHIEVTVKDFLSDLMHLCDALGVEFDGLVEGAGVHYSAELRGEF